MNHPLSRKINVVDLISWRPSYNSLNLCLIKSNVDILFTFIPEIPGFSYARTKLKGYRCESEVPLC